MRVSCMKLQNMFRKNLKITKGIAFQGISYFSADGKFLHTAFFRVFQIFLKVVQFCPNRLFRPMHYIAFVLKPEVE